jgi:hypothetical protein
MFYVFDTQKQILLQHLLNSWTVARACSGGQLLGQGGLIVRAAHR